MIQVQKLFLMHMHAFWLQCTVVGKHLLPLVRYSEIPQDLLLSETEKQSYVNIFSSKVFPYASLTIEEEIGKGLIICHNYYNYNVLLHNNQFERCLWKGVSW